MNARRIADLIGAFRFTYASEDALQAGIAAALEAAGEKVHREVRLGEHGRIDLLIRRGRVGVEVKVAGPPGAVVNQCLRYLEHPAVSELVLVTTRPGHVTALAGVDRVEVVNLSRVA